MNHNENVDVNSKSSSIIRDALNSVISILAPSNRNQLAALFCFCRMVRMKVSTKNRKPQEYCSPH